MVRVCSASEHPWCCTGHCVGGSPRAAGFGVQQEREHLHVLQRHFNLFLEEFVSVGLLYLKTLKPVHPKI